jgi:hypothetical protein
MSGAAGLSATQSPGGYNSYPTGSSISPLRGGSAGGGILDSVHLSSTGGGLGSTGGGMRPVSAAPALQSRVATFSSNGTANGSAAGAGVVRPASGQPTASLARKLNNMGSLRRGGPLPGIHE